MKKMMKAVAGTVLAFAMSSANATVVNFYNGSTLYATMTTTNTTDFSLNFIGTGASGAFINELFMEGPNGTFANTTNAAVTTVSGTYLLDGYGGNLNMDWQIQWPQPNNALRFTTGETSTWSITPTTNSRDFNQIHINAFDGTQSIKLIGCIDGTTNCGGGGSTGGRPLPEPGTLTLLGLGLLGLGYARRVRASK